MDATARSCDPVSLTLSSLDQLNGRSRLQKWTILGSQLVGLAAGLVLEMEWLAIMLYILPWATICGAAVSQVWLLAIGD